LERWAARLPDGQTGLADKGHGPAVGTRL